MIFKKSKQQQRIKRKSTLVNLNDPYIRQKIFKKYCGIPFPRTSYRKKFPGNKKIGDYTYNRDDLIDAYVMRLENQISRAANNRANNSANNSAAKTSEQRNFLRMKNVMDTLEISLVNHLVSLIRAKFDKTLKNCPTSSAQDFANCMTANEKFDENFDIDYFKDTDNIIPYWIKRSLNQFDEICKNTSRTSGEKRDAFICLLMASCKKGKPEWKSNYLMDYLVRGGLNNLNFQNCFSLITICRFYGIEVEEHDKFFETFKDSRNAVKHSENRRISNKIFEQFKTDFNNWKDDFKLLGNTEEEIKNMENILVDEHPEHVFNTQQRGLQIILPEEEDDFNKSLNASITEASPFEFETFKNFFNMFKKDYTSNKDFLIALMTQYPKLLQNYVSGLVQGFKISPDGKVSVGEEDQSTSTEAEKMKMCMIYQMLTETIFDSRRLIDVLNNEKKGGVFGFNKKTVVKDVERIRLYAVKNGTKQLAETSLSNFLELLEQIVNEGDKPYGFRWEADTIWHDPDMLKKLSNLHEAASTIWKSTDVYLNDYLLHFYFDDQSVETAVEQLESTINDNEGDVQQIVGIFFELGLWSGALKKEKIVKSRNVLNENVVTDAGQNAQTASNTTRQVSVKEKIKKLEDEIEKLKESVKYRTVLVANNDLKQLLQKIYAGDAKIADLNNFRKQFFHEKSFKTLVEILEKINDLQQELKKLNSEDLCSSTAVMSGRNSRKRKMSSMSGNDARMKIACLLDRKIEKYDRRIRKLNQIIYDIEQYN